MPTGSKGMKHRSPRIHPVEACRRRHAIRIHHNFNECPTPMIPTMHRQFNNNSPRTMASCPWPPWQTLPPRRNPRPPPQRVPPHGRRLPWKQRRTRGGATERNGTTSPARRDAAAVEAREPFRRGAWPGFDPVEARGRRHAIRILRNFNRRPTGGLRPPPDAGARASPPEECVSSMAQRSKLAIMKDAPTFPEWEEYVSSMAQRSNLAIMKDAPTMLRWEECAGGMEQD